MKFATYDNGTTYGELYLVSKDGKRVVSTKEIVSNLFEAVNNWATVKADLSDLYKKINENLINTSEIELDRCIAPLPRTSQFCDASAFKNHGHLMSQAFKIEEHKDDKNYPLMYQGASDDFIGPYNDVVFLNKEDGIDFEGEFAVVTAEVPMGTQPNKASDYIVLLLQLNDWSLRELGPREMKTGFGFINAKPSSSFAPFAITPDELDEYWKDERIHLDLFIQLNNKVFGYANGREMDFSFGELISHAAKTRKLTAGTIIGSGTVSNKDETVGSSCITEQRIREILKIGKVQTPYLNFGDEVFMEARSPDGRIKPFGFIQQKVIKAN